MKKIVVFAVIFMQFVIARAQSDSSATEHVFELGEILIEETNSVYSADQAQNIQLNNTDAGRALSGMPSVTFHNIGGRSETAVFIRGFDVRGIPVYIDGIPVYVSYDGYVDLGRFKTFDYSKVSLSKGLTAMEYGANTIGGSINLISTKPEYLIDAQAVAGFASGNTYEAGINLGSKSEKFYVQGSYYLTQQEYFPLSKNFVPAQQEDGDKRENSFSSDQKVNMKLGYTPNDNHEFSINYVYQEGEKGTPPYSGYDENIRARFWQWPDWDKQSIYFISKNKIGQKSELKVRAYYDQFYNVVESYDDSAYTSQDMRYAFTSIYDDYTYGGNLVLSNKSLQNNELRFSAHYKTDYHTEYNEGEPERNFSDNTYTLGLDDIYTLKNKVRVTTGIGYNLRQSTLAQDYDSQNNTVSDFDLSDNDALNAQLAVSYLFSGKSHLSFFSAHRTRFATMKNRYSYRMGWALPNPDLESETALHFDLTYKAQLFKMLDIEASAYFIKLNNTIQPVTVEEDIEQMQNTGESEFKGFDFYSAFTPNDFFSVSAVYSFIERKNITNPDLLFTDVPKHKITGNITMKPLPSLELNLNAEYNSDRYSTDYGTVAKAFSLYNFFISYKLKTAGIHAGVRNILDENYALSEGYPEPGRNYFVKLTYRFTK